MTKRQSTKKGSTKGKAEGSKRARRLSVKRRAQLIVNDFRGYDAETRNSIKNSLDGDGSDLGELVRRAETGETILDVSKPLGEAEDRARVEELLSTKRYSESVNARLRASLDKPDELRRLLAAIDAGEKKFDSLFAKSFDDGAMEYAFKAYSAALDHYHANRGDKFALSRLAVVYDEQQPGDTNIVITLPGWMRDRAVSDEEVRHWIQDGELFASTLAHPKCDEAFRTAFGAIYTEEMLDGSGISWMTPEVLRVMFPLVMLSGTGTNHVRDDSKARDILILLHNEFVNEETDREVRKPLGLQ